jgi:protein-S-isoprenylcysteine O-methyltransferase Ste14
MVENVYRVLAAVIVLAGSGISIHVRRRADRASGGESITLRSEHPFLMVSLRLVGITLWLSVLAYLLKPAWMAWSQVELPMVVRLSGAALGAVATALAYWVFSSLGNNVTPTVVTRARHKLVTHGPYHWVRHPLYAVGLLSYLAFALLAANWFVGVLAILVFCIIALRVPQEEQQLIERNGDAYREYARHTGRFFPRLG